MDFKTRLEWMDIERREKEQQQSDTQTAIDVRDGIPRDTGYTSADPRFKRTTTGESIWGAVKNMPIMQTLEARRIQRKTTYDPSFDGLGTTLMASKNDVIPLEERGRLSNAQSQEEWDLIRENQLEQRANTALAMKTGAGLATSFVGTLASLENVMATVGTLGISTVGIVAKTVAGGIMSNAIRGGIVSGAAGHIGAVKDAEANTSLSHEDVIWGDAIGVVAGAVYGGISGNVFMRAGAQPKQLNSLGGALMQSARALASRSVKGSMKDYVAVHGAKYQSNLKLSKDVALKRTGIHKVDIGEVNWAKAHDVEPTALSKEIDRFNTDNDMDVRRQNITPAEAAYNKIPGLQSLHAVLDTSKSRTARALGTVLLESGTNSVVKNATAGTEMDRLGQVFGYGYSPTIRAGFKLYRQRVAREADDSLYKSIVNYKARRRAFDEETMLLMDDIRTGRHVPEDAYSPEVRGMTEDLEKMNFHIVKEGIDANLTGMGDFKYKKGYLTRHHMPIKYRTAIQEHGLPKLITVLQKGLMSKVGGMGLEIEEATKVAKAFVRRYTANTDMSSGKNVLKDDAWEVLEDILREQGIQLDDTLKKVFNKGVRERGKELTKVRTTKRRIPIDLHAEHEGLRMLDLIDTDVEGLYKGYAQSMSGHIALAQRGIPDKQTWDKIAEAILIEDPSLASTLDDLWNTFSSGRVAGGVQSAAARLAIKATVLSMMNNMGTTQLTENGTAIATYTLTDFMSSGSEVMKDMFRGRKSTAATKLSKEVDEHFFPIGKEHQAYPSHLADEINEKGGELGSGKAHSLVKGLGDALTAGVELQGMTSLFNHVRSAQQVMSFNMLMHKIGRYTKGKKQLDEQLASLGISEKLFDSIKSNLVEHGQFKKDGGVDLLGFDKWDRNTYEDLMRAVVRNQSNIVQKALAGEGSAWMSRDMGALLFQFRKFSVESVRKQLLRKHTIDNKMLLSSMVYNTLIAGTVITARNYLNGSNTEADLGDALRSGITYNADIGSIASIWDIGISLTGAPDAYHINPYSSYGDGIFQVPAVSMMNNMSNLGATAIDALDGDLDSGSLRSLRGLPIAGNVPLIGALMHDD